MTPIDQLIQVPSTDIHMTAQQLVEDAPANLSNLKTNWAQAYQVAGEMLRDAKDIPPALRKEAGLLAEAAKEALKYRGVSDGG